MPFHNLNLDFFPSKPAFNVVADGGLDLVSPKIGGNMGSLQECLNYEIGRELGYTPSKGLFEFAGKGAFEVREWFVSDSVPNTTMFPGRLYKSTEGDVIRIVYHSGFFPLPFDTGIGFQLVEGEIRDSYTLLVPDISNLGDFLEQTLANVQKITFESGQDFLSKLTEANQQRVPSYMPTRNVDSIGDSLPGAGAVTSVFQLDQHIYASRDSGSRVSLEFDNAIDGTETEIAPGITIIIVKDSTPSAGPVGDFSDKVVAIAKIVESEIYEGDFGANAGDGKLLVDIIRVIDDSIVLEGTVPANLTFTTDTNLNDYILATITDEIVVIREPVGVLWQMPHLGPSETSPFIQTGGHQFIPWQRVDLGREVQFKDGAIQFTTALSRAFIEDVEDAEVLTRAETASDYDFVRSSIFFQEDWQNMSLASSDDASPAFTRFKMRVSQAGVWKEVSTLLATNFGLDIPGNVVVSGVSVKLKHRQGSGTANTDVRLKSARLLGAGNSSKKTDGAILPASGGSIREDVLGGKLDSWGTTSLNRATVNSKEFGVEIQYEMFGDPAFFVGLTEAFPRVNLYYLEITVHFTDGTQRVFFWDGNTDVAEADVVHFRRMSGAWDTNDASGIITIYDVENGDPEDITTNLEIRTLAGGVGDLLAVTDSKATEVVLPSYQDLLDNSSRVVTIEKNFFSDESGNAIYGATGAGPAFMFNGRYFVYIRTGLVEEKEKPRHVAEHAQHLVLGYSSGQASHSVVGEPLNFEGIDGAGEFGFGDKITGFTNLEGNALGVFSTKSIHAVIGNTIENFTTQVISGSTGAVEYTVVNMGQPIYADFRGIATMQTSSVYGDFVWGRLSKNITPLLQPRLQNISEKAAFDELPIVAVPVRNKNQYRLYFNDGFILTMTMQERNEPSVGFTIQHYDPEELSREFVPSAINSFVLPTGQEIILLGTRGGRLYSVDGASGIYRQKYVDGNIPVNGLPEVERVDQRHSIVFNPFVIPELSHLNLRFNQVLIHGIVKFNDALEVSMGTNYLMPDESTFVDNIFFGNKVDSVSLVGIPHYQAAHLPNISDGVSLKIQGVSKGQPEHIVQILTFRALPMSDKNLNPRRQ